MKMLKLKNKLIGGLIAASIIGTTVFGAENNTNFFEEKKATVAIKDGFIFIYNRNNYKKINQDKFKIYRELYSSVCANSEIKKWINNGAVVHYIYLYDDGILNFSIDECK